MREGGSVEDPLQEFAQRLRDLHARAGSPSLRDLERLTERAGRRYPRSTISEKLAGASLPDWEFVKAFVAACARSDDVTGEDLTEWRAEHRSLLQAIGASRAGSRRAVKAADQLATEPQSARKVSRPQVRSARGCQQALTGPGWDGHDGAEFVDRYRRQARELHGCLEPPDFERRDPFPITDIYVPPEIREVPRPGQDRLPFLGKRPRLTAADLPRLIERTVLLGDPGGGKTTAACVLMHSQASDPAAKIPFLVMLSEYAAASPPERSIVEHIEHALRTSYECRPPNGLVEQLLDAGSALVIFDGLDELLDGPRRRGVSRRIEQFCSRYRRAPVLVTCREIGYDRARLKDGQFTCYRLAGFGRREIEAYVHTWFSDRGKAEAFLIESATADDLRSNPLLLSLMCILYQDTGSLPIDRAGLYEQCAALLLRKWDEERGIRHSLRARIEVEPLVRHLAWWLFSEPQAIVIEGRLLAEITKYLHEHGFESADEARHAAREFVDFCRERTWALNGGITAAGGKGYTFTHRTLLEYYAAAYIVTELCKTPEELAGFLKDRIALDEWDTVDLLSVSVMERAIEGAADRVYTILLEDENAPADCGELLSFLAVLLESARPSPTVARTLIRKILSHRIAFDLQREITHPLLFLMSGGAWYDELLCDEMNCLIGTMVASDDTAQKTEALRIVLEVAHSAHDPFWRNWATEQASHYAAEISAGSAESSELRTLALYAEIITMDQAIAMPGGLSALLEPVPHMLESNLAAPYPGDLYMRLPVSRVIAEHEFAAIGRYIISHPLPPWARTSSYEFSLADICNEKLLQESTAALDEVTSLGFAVVHAICSEVFGWHGERPWADLPMPAQFRRTFRDWANYKVNLAEG